MELERLAAEYERRQAGEDYRATYRRDPVTGILPEFDAHAEQSAWLYMRSATTVAFALDE